MMSFVLKRMNFALKRMKFAAEFKTAIMSRVGNRLIAGAQGFVQELPPNYRLSFALVGREDGVTSAMYAYGSLLREAHNTAQTKLPLATDPLSRQLHYVTDGGSLLNYCDYYPQCINWTNRSQWPGGPIGCTPQSETLRAASAYHKSLNLNVSVYHVDPYWFSHHPLGGCLDGASATNLTASPWHFPDGLRSMGIQMQLFLQSFNPKNIYTSQYEWAGQSVGAKDAGRFFADRFNELTSGDSECSSLTLDGVNDVFFSDVSRYNNTWAQTAYDKSLADAALAHGLPIRIDQQLPSDILASVLYGARTVARCTGDANPCGGKDPSGPYASRGWPACSTPSRYSQLAGVALLLAPLHVRPFTDDIWTIETQG